MSRGVPHLIVERDLSTAWAQAFSSLMHRPGHELAPLVVSFGGLKGDTTDEISAVRETLDACLRESGMQAVHTVANTIFPQAIWRQARGDRTKLYASYLENLPTYVAWEPRRNGRGLYFARLVAFNADPKTGLQRSGLATGACADADNQLEFIIQHMKKGVRRSMFQATLFDPERDHSPSARLGFPCLQHVTFVPDFADGSLTLNGFYATQQLFEKAYGNFLGLARLGIFVAQETGLELGRVNCFVGVEKMDRRPTHGAALDSLERAVHAVMSGESQEDGQHGRTDRS